MQTRGRGARHNVLLIGAAVGAALLVGCGKAPAAAPVAPTSAPPVAVTADTVRRGDIQQTLAYSGEIRARQQISVLPKATGRVEHVLVDTGSQVKTGDVLVVLDQDAPRIQVLQARSALAQAQARLATLSAGPRAEDVAAGRASTVNQTIRKMHVVAPVGCFFEQVARVDPQNPDAGYEGIGRFFTENYLLYAIGVPLQRLGPAGVVASRWLFDSLFPFVCLIVLSLITPANRSTRAAGFYAKLKTPVAPTPEKDRAEVEKSYAEPHRFDDLKLMPWTNWEFTKWTRKDFAGFFGCWGIVGVILAFLWIVLHVGA